MCSPRDRSSLLSRSHHRRPTAPDNRIPHGLVGNSRPSLHTDSPSTAETRTPPLRNGETEPCNGSVRKRRYPQTGSCFPKQMAAYSDRGGASVGNIGLTRDECGFFGREEQR